VYWVIVSGEGAREGGRERESLHDIMPGSTVGSLFMFTSDPRRAARISGVILKASVWFRSAPASRSSCTASPSPSLIASVSFALVGRGGNGGGGGGW
jgi:hypothetical protein